MLKALQSGTSHYMGTNFAEAFNISFNDVNNEQAFAHTTSWGFSTRSIGAIIMAHGDDKGLVMPPKLAPHQVVIVPIYRKNDDAARQEVMAAVDSLASELRDEAVRVTVDDREGMSPGWKFNDWEQKGVPLRLELGPKDLQKGEVVVSNRLKEGKETVKLAEAGTCSSRRRLQRFTPTFLRAPKLSAMSTPLWWMTTKRSKKKSSRVLSTPRTADAWNAKTRFRMKPRPPRAASPSRVRRRRARACAAVRGALTRGGWCLRGLTKGIWSAFVLN